MSVPVPKRGQGELEVNTKARALTVYTLKMSFATWIDHICKGNSTKLAKRMTDFYNNLWKDDLI